MIYHNGAAEMLGVSQEQLENMSLRELCYRAYDLGIEPIFKTEGGVGPGLTLTGDQKESQHDNAE